MSTNAREAASAGADRHAFAHYLRTGRRTVPLELKFNPNHDPDTGRFTSAEGASQASGASGGSTRLTPEAKAFVDKIDRDFFLRTGKHIHVNSGTRDAAGQAKAMVDKGPETWGIYTNRRALSEIRAAYDRSTAAGADNAARKKAVADVVGKQMAQGRYISNHLISRAVDLRLKDRTPGEEALMKDLSRRHGASKVLYEGKPKHLHVQF